MKTIICEICQKPFKVKAYRKHKARFCSAACYGKHQSVSRLGIGRKRITIKCDTCGKDIEKQPSTIKDHNFCNRECFSIWRSSDAWCGENNPSWKGGHTDYRGPNWKRQSKRALNRDNNTCQHCGIYDVNLHVHHIKPYHLFDDYKKANQLDNLIALCATCHAIADNTFWQENPDLVSSRRIPHCVIPQKKCVKCNKAFIPRSPATKICDKCCTFVCVNCNKSFSSRKLSDRIPKYCSKKCRNDAIKAPKKFCETCGKEFSSRRKVQKFCSLQCSSQIKPHWNSRSKT